MKHDHSLTTGYVIPSMWFMPPHFLPVSDNTSLLEQAASAQPNEGSGWDRDEGRRSPTCSWDIWWSSPALCWCVPAWPRAATLPASSRQACLAWHASSCDAEENEIRTLAYSKTHSCLVLKANRLVSCLGSEGIFYWHALLKLHSVCFLQKRSCMCWSIKELE